LVKEGYTIKGNYLFTASVLEEPAEQIGMIGLYEHTLQHKGYIVDGAVSCESTSPKLYLGHRGSVELDVEICGVTAHASAPWLGLNPVNKATKFVDAVEARHAGDIRVDPKLGKSSIALTIISCSPGAMCIVLDRCNIVFDRRLVPTETPEDAVREIQEIIDRLEAEDPHFHASVKISAVPRKTYTGKTVTIPNIKQGWRIEEEHPFVKACADALASLGEPVGYGYWNFGTDLALPCGSIRSLPWAIPPCRNSIVTGRLTAFAQTLRIEPLLVTWRSFSISPSSPRRSFDCHKRFLRAELHRLRGACLTALCAEDSQIKASFFVPRGHPNREGAEVGFFRETRRSNLRGILSPKSERVKRTRIPATSLVNHLAPGDMDAPIDI
jgi:hypothetical protein